MLIKFVYNQKKEVREREKERNTLLRETERKIEGYFDERERDCTLRREREKGRGER